MITSPIPERENTSSIIFSQQNHRLYQPASFVLHQMIMVRKINNAVVNLTLRNLKTENYNGENPTTKNTKS